MWDRPKQSLPQASNYFFNSNILEIFSNGMQNLKLNKYWQVKGWGIKRGMSASS